MKLCFANPATGQQKTIEIDDERKTRIFYEKRMAQEVPADALGDEFKGYVVRITGGNDKQGFPLKQGVLVPHRVRLLLAKGHSCYRPRRDGERKRKSVRGCIVGPDVRALHLVVVKQGEADIPGLTDTVLPKRLGPSARPRSAASSTSTSRTTCASLSSAARLSRRRKAPSPTPRRPRSRGLLRRSACSAAVTCARSSAARPSARRPRRPSTT